MNLTDKIEKHRQFLERKNNSPLIGYHTGGWEDLSGYVEDTEGFFKKGVVRCEDLKAEMFSGMYDNLAEAFYRDDDLFRTLEPLPFFPWSEACAGCEVTFTGKNFWVKPGQLKTTNGLVKRGEWIDKYREFVVFLSRNYSEKEPVGQPILRGPLDMTAGIFSDKKTLLLFYDEPEFVKETLSACAEIFTELLRIGISEMPEYSGGHVIGQYYIWTPGTCARLQDDAMALVSPEIYARYVLDIERKISGVADYNLFHLHSTGLFLLDYLLQNEKLKIIQFSKDEGCGELSQFLPALKKIQQSGKCLVIKGKFSEEDLNAIKDELSPQGLCIQHVLDNSI